MNLIRAYTQEDIPEVRTLFLEYQKSLGIDLCFQSFDEELKHLPGDYALPDGRLLIAMDEERIAGCVALRRISNSVCEMKRLYLRPEFRGKGIGRMLAIAILDEARGIGYATMRLDTLPVMTEAIALYQSLGFKQIDPYRFNPVEGAMFMEMDLEGKE
jgi:ribosomal protein S18 acetylase RimI-like enzyme